MDGEADPSSRPDWRDAAKYEYTQALSSEAWAWEFLRRNPEYSDAWSKRPLPSANQDDKRSQVHAAPSAALSAEAAAWGLVTFRRSGSRGG